MILFSSVDEDLTDFDNIIFMLIFLSGISILLLSMISEKISYKFYSIKKDKLMGSSIISFTVGFCFGLFGYLLRFLTSF
ncbi:hypothetical protein GCM10023330_13180 [Litoribaculum gwangyangense]|uniref:Uncharacterized protein n=1 Tax=Litoribaculum gwangyangense TaxID=1130722 RepID=A0ABP9CFA6_9FLAO